MRALTWHDRFWKVTAGLLAALLAVTIAVTYLRSSSTNATSTSNAHALAVENRYLAQVADFANYLAETNHIICTAQHLACPPVPHYPDPPGLPALGLGG